MTIDFPQFDLDIPYITTDQMREVDRAMIEDFGITLLQMMENAGLNLAGIVGGIVDGTEAPNKRVLVAAGPGGNGGGGLAAGRHLHNHGFDVTVVLGADESKSSEAMHQQLSILKKLGVDVLAVDDERVESELSRSAVVIDALFGYSLHGAPREPVASLIRLLNDSNVPVVSNDVPTGIDSTSGEIYEPAVRATATITIALPKTGLQAAEAKQLVGDLYLGDISVPVELYREALGIAVPSLFDESQVIKIA